MSGEISRETWLEMSADELKVEMEKRKKEKEVPKKIGIVEADDIADKIRATRLRELKRFLESIDCWNLANTGAKPRFVWDEVKAFLVTDKPINEIEDLSFLTTLKRQLLQLYKQGYPQIEAHQRKQFAYTDKEGKQIPLLLLELEFVKPRESRPLSFTLVVAPQEKGVAEAIAANKARTQPETTAPETEPETTAPETEPKVT